MKCKIFNVSSCIQIAKRKEVMSFCLKELDQTVNINVFGCAALYMVLDYYSYL